MEAWGRQSQARKALRAHVTCHKEDRHEDDVYVCMGARVAVSGLVDLMLGSGSRKVLDSFSGAREGGMA